MRRELPTAARVQPVEKPKQEPPPQSPPKLVPTPVRKAPALSLDVEDWLILAVLVLSLLEQEEEPSVALLAAALYLFLQ